MLYFQTRRLSVKTNYNIQEKVNMKMFGRLSGIMLLAGAMIVLSGCSSDEPGNGGTVPPAWDEPGTPRIGAAGMNGKDNWDSRSGEVPSSWGEGATDGALDERTGVRRVEVAGFPKTLYFGYDTDRVKSSELDKIADAAAIIKSRPDLVLVIEGHCDERGTEEYNRALGERRAIAVENKMRENGVDLASIRTVSYGEDKPAASGSGESVWSQNRRAELWVGKAAGK